MKITRFLFLLMIVAMLSALLTYFFYNHFIIENTVNLDMYVNVGDHFGLNADADAIRFGMVKPGTSGERSIFVNNSAAYPLRVIILKSGYIADWVTTSDNNFVLSQNEGKDIIFEVHAPKNAYYGNYNGKVQIIFKKVFLRQ